MLVIRLRRTGSNRRPAFRVVVIDSRSSRDGRSVEVLGHYQPRTRPEQLVLDYGRLQYWLSVGARPSATVRTLVARHPAPPAVAVAAEAPATAESSAS